MSVFRKTERRARKPHRCLFCGRGIAAGERYIDGFWIYEGEPAPWQSHLACQDIADHSIYAADGGGVAPFLDWGPDAVAELPEAQRRAFDAVARAAP